MRLEVVDLAFGYPERPVGRNVTLAVEPGEILCLLGPNGCGKTTLFRTLLGLLRPQGGRVKLDGADLGGLARPAIARRIAYVPQAQGAAFPYTALSELGIAGLVARDVTRLSGGQRQLVIIARAIAQAAPLIVMDEPTASLDFGNQVVVLSEVKRLAARGAGVILSTHDPDHAFAVATRVALMRDGEILAEGTPEDVLTADRLKSVYGVAVSIERLAGGQTVCAPRYG